MIALDDEEEEDVLDVPSLDQGMRSLRANVCLVEDMISQADLTSDESPAARYGFPTAHIATSEPPAARLALQPPRWAGADVFWILFLM
nr:hypothetical protein [Tanacetum cinerariifolium]